MSSKVKITEKTFKESINRIAALDDGKIVFAWLAHYCFHEGAPLERGNLENTYANAAVQNVYRAMRSFIRSEHLRTIEFDYALATREEANENE